MNPDVANISGSNRRLAVYLSWPAWAAIVAGLALGDSMAAPVWKVFEVVFLICCLGCSPASLVLFLRMRQVISAKALWILWTGLPILAGCFVAWLKIIDIKC